MNVSCSKSLAWLAVFATVAMISTGFAQPMPEMIWSRSGLYNNSRYGSDISSLGDQNDDGFQDWAVSASAVWNNYPDQSYIELFHGGDPPNNTPYFSIVPSDSVYLVVGVRGVGDLNEDGFIDWMVILWPELQGPSLHAYFYWGGPSNDLLPDFDHPVGYQDRYDGMGDFNGDGFDDLFLSSTESGIGQVVFGGDPLDLEPDWTIHDNPPGSYSSLPIAFGDLNGDGYTDILSYYDDEGQMVWFGSSDPDTIPQIIGDIESFGTYHIVKDLNGDGRDELLVTSVGHIDVYFGGETLSSLPDYSLNMPMGSWGDPIVSIGDFNNDGYNDMVAVSTDHPFGSGMFAMFLGHRWIPLDPAFYVLGRGWEYLVGIQEACALGDVNGDGIDDFGIGATNGDLDGMPGRAIIIAGNTDYVVGAATLPPILPESMELSVYPNPFNSETTIEFSLPPFVTDITLRIYDVTGRTVEQLKLNASSNVVRYHFRGNSLPTGIYFVSAMAGTSHATTKMMIVR
ncbi:T9SS type A sorting domain-containing protein [bacterium]|nr:T9SS type A sorting domain-containing protein [bacterium]